MASMKLAALLNDGDKSRALAGKLAKLAEKRRAEQARKRDEENAAEASTPTGAAVQQTRRDLLDARRRLREREAAEFEKLLDGVDLNADGADEDDKRKEYLVLKRNQRQLEADVTDSHRQSDKIPRGSSQQSRKPRQQTALREASVIHDLKQRKQSYMELLPSLDREIEAAKQELAREQGLLQQANEMRDGVNDRIIEIYSTSGETSPEHYFRDLARKIHAKRQEDTDITVELEQTVLEPDPAHAADEDNEEDPEDTEDIRRYFNPRESSQATSRDDERREFLLLLSDLMQAMEETPVDPYISVADYDLRVRIKMIECGVAIEHPSDAARLRLIEFHKTFEDDDEEDRESGDDEEAARRQLLDYYNEEGDLSDEGEVGEDDMAI